MNIIIFNKLENTSPTMNKFTKVGKTFQDELKRFNNYPKGLQLHLHISCLNSVEVERIIITEFNNLFQNVKLYGK